VHLVARAQPEQGQAARHDDTDFSADNIVGSPQISTMMMTTATTSTVRQQRLRQSDEDEGDGDGCDGEDNNAATIVTVTK
jgi:hypothetical protein